MVYPRFYEQLDKYLKKNKVLVIYGPRQVGKTTLIKNFLKNTNLKYRLDNGENINIQGIISSQNFESIKEYCQGSYSLTPSSFLSYVSARKEYKVITDLGGITGSGIYVYNGDISINSNATPFNQPYNIVLLVSGTLTISSAPDNTFTPTGAVAIVATAINFDNTVTEAQGIFIGNTVSTGTNTNQGLKIIGNLVAQTTFSNNREWSTTTRPSVFIKFDQAKYIYLIPYLSTANYNWKQVQ